MDLGHDQYQNRHYGSQAQALTCPSCDRPILPTTKFCAHCRAAILRRYCPGCGKLVPDAAYLCPYCDTPSTAPQKKKGSYASFAAGATILVIFAYFLISTSVDLPKDQPPTAVDQLKAATNAPSKTPVPEKPKQMPPAASTPASQPAPTAPSQATPYPADGERLNYQGHQLMQQKKFAEAVVVLRKAVDALNDPQAPAYGYARFNLGQSLRITGNAKEAIPFLEEALQVIPQKELAQNELSKAQQILEPQ